MSDYNYRPLETCVNEIRLLRIRRVDPSSKEPLTLIIRHVALNDAAPFNALSYAWGQESPSHQLPIRDESSQGLMRIRTNLLQFLLTARESSDRWSTEWIWIDQICINQEDHAERCDQVDKMAKLYASAQQTIIWPGETVQQPQAGEDCTLLSEPVFTTEQLMVLRNTPFDHVPYHPHLHSWRMESRVPSAAEMELLAMMSRRLLNDLFFSTYWTRVWVIQEMVLTPQAGVVVLGGLIRLGALCAIVALLNVHNDKLRFEEWCEDPHQQRVRLGRIRTKLAFVAIQGSTMRHGTPNREQSWTRALMAVHGSECSLRLDRIYGVMGMVEEDVCVRTDYTISPQQLLRKILDRQMSLFQVGSQSPGVDPWASLYQIVRIWDTLDMEPERRISGQPLCIDYDNSEENLAAAEFHVRKVLQELKLPVILEIAVASV
jgi:hypothetical protein